VRGNRISIFLEIYTWALRISAYAPLADFAGVERGDRHPHTPAHLIAAMVGPSHRVAVRSWRDYFRRHALAEQFMRSACSSPPFTCRRPFRLSPRPARIHHPEQDGAPEDACDNGLGAHGPPMLPLAFSP